MNLWPNTLQTKEPVVIVHGSPRWKLVRQHTPRTARSVKIKDGVNHLLHVYGAGAAAGLGWRNQSFYELPLLIRKIAWIWRPFHILLHRLRTTGTPTFHTRSKNEH